MDAERRRNTISLEEAFKSGTNNLTYQDVLADESFQEKTMYEDARISDEERKADLIKNAFSEITAKIKSSDLPPDNKTAAFGEVTLAIKEMLKDLITK